MRRTRLPSRAAPELLTATLHRMKARAGGLLAWAIDFAQTELDGLAPTGWYNLRLELAAFLIPFSVEVPQRYGSMPSDDGVREVHESFARIFFRNCVATGELYPYDAKERLCEKVKTGDIGTLDFDADTLTVNGTTYSLKPLGEVRPVIDAGGIFNYARQSGMIAAKG